MPLTEAQKYKHWNKVDGWGRVCLANAWRMIGERLAPEARRDGPGEWHAKVWAFAEAIAQKNHRAVTPDDLRKGSYMFALGCLKSFTKFDNADLDRVLVVFRLLIEPEDLSATKDWLAYEVFEQARAEIDRCRRQGVSCNITLPNDPGERRRHLYFISQSPQAVIQHFVNSRFHGVLPEDMSLRDLRDFSRTLKNRRDYSARPAVPRATPQLQEVEEPF